MLELIDSGIAFFYPKQVKEIEFEDVYDVKQSQKKKDYKNKLKDEVLDDILIKVDTLMEENCLYRNHNYTLGDLAQEIATNRTYLSAALSKKKGVSYPTYLNKKRIEMAIPILLQKDRKNCFVHTIADVAFISGFSTERSFYRAMLKFENMSPGQYRLKYSD